MDKLQLDPETLLVESFVAQEPAAIYTQDPVAIGVSYMIPECFRLTIGGLDCPIILD